MFDTASKLRLSAMFTSVLVSIGAAGLAAEDPKEDEKAKVPPKVAAKAEKVFKKGHDAFTKKNIRAAEALYRKAIEINPEEPRYHRQLAVLLTAVERGQEAHRAALMAVSLDPEDWRSQIVLGTIYNLQGRNREEVELYKQTLKLLPPEEKDVKKKLEDHIRKTELALKEAKEKEERKREQEEQKYKHVF